MAPFILLVFVIAIFIVVLLGPTRTRQTSQRRIQDTLAQPQPAATLRGWQHTVAREHGATVYRYTGATNGIPWTLESSIRLAHPRSSDGPPAEWDHRRTTRWSSAAVSLPGEVIMLLPYRASASQIHFGDPTRPLSEQGLIIRMLAGPMLEGLRHSFAADERAVGLLWHAAPFTPDDPQLRERFTIAASDAASAQAFLNPVVARALVGWAETQPAHIQAPLPSLLLWDGGLTLVFAAWGADHDGVESVAMLGAALVEACRMAEA